MLTQKNTFFTTDMYENEIALEANETLLQRIYNEDIYADDELPLDFVFITDTWQKAEDFKWMLMEEHDLYTEVIEANGRWEIQGSTSPIQIHLEAINKWHTEMWDLGYDYDCKFESWKLSL
jgi:hypothetical protein